MVVQHNLSAMNANRMLNLTVKSQAGSTEKLSSGYRINRAADDAAGLSISEKMRKQIRGLTQASSNAQDGISMVQTAEGALGEVHDMLQRMNELAVKAANGTLSDDDRQYIQNEVDQIMLEIDRVKESTKFNEIYVLKGSSVHHTRQGYIAPIENDIVSPDLDNRVLGIYAGTKLSEYVDHYVGGSSNGSAFASGSNYAVGFADFSNITTREDVLQLVGEGISTTCTQCQEFYGFKLVDKTATGLNTDGYRMDNSNGCRTLWVDISECNNGQEVVSAVMKAYAKANGETDYAAKTAYNLGGSVAVLGADGFSHHNYIAANGSTIAVFDSSPTSDNAKHAAAAKNDPDYKGWYAFQRGVYSRNIEEYLPDGKTISIHVGADATKNNQIEVPLGNLDTVVLGLKSYEFDIRTGAYNWFNNADVTTAAKALKCITAVSAAIQEVSTQRSRFGAIQNRLEHTINNLDNVVENTTSAESQIRDTDMATEMVKYSNNNILAQAGQAMLAQANQGNQGVLSLLQ